MRRRSSLSAGVALALMGAAQTSALAWPSTSALDQGISSAIHADVASSVRLPGGKALWVFGDTTEVNGHSTVGAFGYPHDAFALQSPGSSTFSVLHGPYGFGWQQAPNWPDGTYFWATIPLVDGNTLWVLGVRVRGVDPFTVVGDYAAEFDASTLRYRGIVALPGGGTVWGGRAQVSNGWWLTGTHAVSCVDATDCKVGDVAFVPFGHLGTPSSWQVHKNVIPATLNAGTVIALDRLTSGWMAWTKQGDSFGGTDILRLQAPSPLGPWSITGHWNAPVVTSGDVTYGVAAHPEQPAPSGSILVSYDENGTTYHPQFLYLPLSGG